MWVFVLILLFILLGIVSFVLFFISWFFVVIIEMENMCLIFKKSYLVGGVVVSLVVLLM